MAGFKTEQVLSMKMHPGLRQVVRMQQSTFLQLPDADFHSLIAEIERSPLFRRLYHEEKLIRYRKFPGTDIRLPAVPLKEEAVAGSGSPDIESLLEKREYAVRRIEKLGMEKFNRYFLFPEAGITAAEIAAACGLETREMEAINAFINDFAVISEFHRSPGPGAPAVTYTRIASVEKCAEGFAIGYFSPVYARGRYQIDHGGFERLLAEGRFSPGEAGAARNLFKKLELVNHRKHAIDNILHGLVGKQRLYLESGKSMSLLPYSQKELAGEIGVVPSTVSRAVHGKSVIAPWGEELPLLRFFPKPRRFRKELIGQLLRDEPGLASDEATRSRLREKLGIAISRRSVAELRRELKIPARGRRGKNKEMK